MEFAHRSVLLEETIEYLNIRPDGIYVDGTLGGAGHSGEICKRLSDSGRLIGIDQDEDAIRAATKRLEPYKEKVTIIRDNYCNMKTRLEEIGIQGVDGILLDLGVSSYQLDDPERGFTYRECAPLDMRMDRRQSKTARDIVNGYSELDLYRIIRDYGEEKYANSIARNIVLEREKKESNYVTAVVKDASFELEKSADVFRELYQALNNHIIIGRNQILVAEEIREEREILPEEQENLENFESLLERRDIPKAKMKCREIFRIWKETGKSQIYVETKVRYLFMLLNRYHLLAETEKNCEWIIDDLFYFATDIDEILNVILQTMFLKPQKGIRTGKADTPEFFGMIESYIRKNLAAPISMQLLCREFGISQTYLSKLFRKYENCSFNKFLNTTRMERAKELMEENKFYYVKDIAAKVGFDDQYYFSRIFTSMTGMCPTDYMEQFSDKEGSSI